MPEPQPNLPFSLPERHLKAVPPPSPVVIEVPLKGAGVYAVTQEQVDQWADAFPAVDVLAELKILRQWNRDNPARRKTRRGFARHVYGWMSRARDRASQARTRTPEEEVLWGKL